jgi:hypothetical protein
MFLLVSTVGAIELLPEALVIAKPAKIPCENAITFKIEFEK